MWTALAAMAFATLATADAPIQSSASIVAEDFEYVLDGQTYLGYIAYDASREGVRPGVVIVHDWNGVDEYEKYRADLLARLGYVALAIDVYGKDRQPQSQQENAERAGEMYADRNEFRKRLNHGVELLKDHELVDRSRVAAIGYCFGGAGVLELARMGASLAGVVSFHGSLTTDMPAEEGNVNTKIMVMHAIRDPAVPIEDLIALFEEMIAADADFQVMTFNVPAHSFTNRFGSQYFEDADRRSWHAMRQFFDEIFN